MTYVTRKKILEVMQDSQPRTAREIRKLTGLSDVVVCCGLSRAWRAGLLLRSEKSFCENSEEFRGRAGKLSQTRTYYFYLLPKDDVSEATLNGMKFVQFDRKYLDRKGQREGSKARWNVWFCATCVTKFGGDVDSLREIRQRLKKANSQQFKKQKPTILLVSEWQT